ncbi:splicing factor YJU2-like [Babylonia areolata]|uniref:splicing factor YJU2-like n=1 Tax=Babylonia areolata TaxID=304850 RepID=UPI003FD3C1D1
MSERKVLNKYYPPGFDPSKIPKLREPKNKVFSIRIMAPFNMRCNVCGEYIYKGKKFNSRKENVDDEDYLGLRIFRFYIRCPKCVAEIAFKTDLKNTDYTLEAGATRLFEAEKLAQQMAEQERLEKEAEELNPMKVLENRTKASHKEMAQIDELEELREINARHALVDTSTLLEKEKLYEEHLQRLQQEEEDQIVESIFGTKQRQIIKRLADSDSEESDDGKPKTKRSTPGSVKVASDHLMGVEDAAQNSKKEQTDLEPWQKSVGTLSFKKSLASLVKKKPASKTCSVSSSSNGTSLPATPSASVSLTEEYGHSSSDLLHGKTSLVSGLKDEQKKTSSETDFSVVSSAASGSIGTHSSALGLLEDYSSSDDSN